MYEVVGDQITLVKGDTLYAIVEVYDGDEPYTPAENDVIRFAMSLRYSDDEPLVEKVIPNDTLILKLEPEDTEDLAALTYVYDIELTKENGDKDTFIRGTLKLLDEVA